MNALIIGGNRHGEWVDVLDGVAGWVDLATATTFRVRKLSWGITRIGAGGAELTGENYTLRLLVHPDLANLGAAEEQMIVTQMLQMQAMNLFVRTHGEPIEPDPVPETPAALFGPNGEPL